MSTYLFGYADGKSALSLIRGVETSHLPVHTLVILHQYHQETSRRHVARVSCVSLSRADTTSLSEEGNHVITKRKAPDTLRVLSSLEASGKSRLHLNESSSHLKIECSPALSAFPTKLGT